jgi:hypothetical protein
VWFGSVDIPEDVVSAHKEGRLVLFVGAGASMGAPSNLPDFNALAAQIASESSHPLTAQEVERPDLALGQIEALGVDVHQRVAELVGDPASKPNRLHTAIVDLALASPNPRIVTTNYDRHQASILGARNAQIEEFAAPALPMGDHFDGLVHLHGGLHKDPATLVVTDGDFGHAYLLDAWAARFLERMYRSYAVLFIGYSHSDMVMSYMARALGPGSRYALTDETTRDARWRQLGITPIRYQLNGTSHEALDVVIERWAEQAGMGLLDHRQRITLLAGSSPPIVPEQVSYLEASLLETARAQIFTELAHSVDWLKWVAPRAPFKSLFSVSSPDDDLAAVFAWWFARRFVVVEDRTSTALSVAQRSGTTLGRAVWRAVAQQIHAMAKPRPAWINPWIVLLIESADAGGREFLEYILHACRLPEDEEVALLLFDHLCEPHAIVEPGFGPEVPTRVAVEPHGTQYWLQESLELVFKPALPQIAGKLVSIVDRNLRRFHYLLASDTDRLDPVSFARHAIEPHPQDGIPQPVDVVIDAARDCLEMLLDSGDPMGPALIDSWSASGVPILERLAIHGWCHRTDASADQKISKLTAEGWVFEDHLRHEAFRLVAQELAQASTPIGDAYVQSIVSWSP